MMDDALAAFSRSLDEPGRAGGMVAKGNWKTDSVTNSNEDRKTTKQATIGGA